MQKKKQRKRTKKWWIIIGVIASISIIASAIVLVLNLSKKQEPKQSSIMKINQSYLEGKLSVDQYVNSLLDAAYQQGRLSDTFRSNVTELAPNQEILNLISAHPAEIDSGTFSRISEMIGMANIEFDTDASGNVSESKPTIWFPFMAKNAYAENRPSKILNKAMRSRDGHFVVFYTDTGEDQITDETAGSLLEMAEEIIRGYSTNLRLEYRYEKADNNLLKINSMKKVLKASGVDEDALDFAMPIYVVNTHQQESTVKAYYMSRAHANILGITSYDTLGGIPSFPYINLISYDVRDEDLKMTLAHELGHHFINEYCRKTFNDECSKEGFINEALPDFFATEVMRGLPKDNFINRQHYELAYLGLGTDMKISEVLPNYEGYPAYAFLINYYEKVPDGLNKMMESLNCKNVLQCLYDKAGEDSFRKTMISLMERNVTSSYSNELPIGSENFSHYEDPACEKMCTKSYVVEPAAARYVVIFPDLNDGGKMYVSARENVAVSLIGIKNGETRTSDVIFSGKLDNYTYDIVNGGDYDMIMVGATNYGIIDPSSFTLRIVPKEYEEIVDITKAIGKGCSSSVVDSADEAIDEFEKTTDAMEMLFGESDFLTMIREIKDDMASNAGGKYVSTTCENSIRSGLSRSEVIDKIYGLLGDGVKHGESEFLFVNFDTFMRADKRNKDWKLYILIDGLGQMQLLTMEINAE